MKCNYKEREKKGEMHLFLNYLGMLTGFLLALANILNSGFEGFMRWLMVVCGLLIFMCHLKIVLDKKHNRAVNKNENNT